MADNSALRAEASTTTDPARLAAIVQEDPTLGAVVAANPVAYDALLDWLLAYGDDAAKAAVASRRGAVAAPAAAAPSAPAAPKKPMSPTMKKGLLFGGIGLGALAVIIVAVVALTNVLGGGSSTGIRTMEIGSEPRDDAWGIITPQLEDGDLDDDSLLWANGQTVAQDRALVQWSATDENYDDQGDPLISLIDTKNGGVLWTVEWDDPFTVISAPGATPFLLSVADDDGYTVYSVDPGNGDVISDTKGLDGAGVYARNAFDEPLAGLGGDVIIRSEDGIGRYSPNDFDEEKWLIDLDDDEFPYVAANRIIIGDNAYSIDNGEEVDWEADDDISFTDFGGRIFGSEGSSDDLEFGLYDQAGEQLWSRDGDGAEVVFAEGQSLLLHNEDDEELIAIDPATGDERWTTDLDEGYYLSGGSEAVGYVIASSSDDEKGIVIDLASGEEISSFDAEDFELNVIGASKNFFYISGNEDRDLVAIDVRSGDEAWTLDNPGEYYYSLLGGNIVGFMQQELDDAEDDALIIGIQP